MQGVLLPWNKEFPLLHLPNGRCEAYFGAKRFVRLRGSSAFSEAAA
jgi:hypothetical protein